MIDLTHPQELKELLVRHGFQPKKKFSQNFLISKSTIDQICNCLNQASGILEIGPGPGVLTSVLSESVAKLIAIEIDPIAVSALEETAPNAEIIQSDFLKLDLIELLQKLPEPRAIVSNMPYHITGLLLNKIAQARCHYQKVVLMMQKEVGQKILAQPGSSDCGSLSIFLQSQFNIRKVTLVKNTAFYPAPKVDSIVLEFTPKLNLVENDLNGQFFEFVRQGFLHPRKTLLNNLLQSGKYNRGQIDSVLSDLGLIHSIRPHQLSIDQWKRLSHDVSRTEH